MQVIHDFNPFIHQTNYRLWAEAGAAADVKGTTEPLTLKARLAVDMKDAMKNKQKSRLSAIRSIQTAIKQKEVDDRVDVGH